VALLEVRRIAVELVAQLAPRVLVTRLRQRFPVFLDLRVGTQRHQLDRPDQDLPKFTDELAGSDVGFRHRPLAQTGGIDEYRLQRPDGRKPDARAPVTIGYVRATSSGNSRIA